jgi:hypothetical protein
MTSEFLVAYDENHFVKAERFRERLSREDPKKVYSDIENYCDKHCDVWKISPIKTCLHCQIWKVKSNALQASKNKT